MRRLLVLALLLAPVPASAQETDVKKLLAQADAAREKGEHKEALEFARQAAKADPKNGRAWYAMGLAQSALREHKEAIDAFHKALELDPKLVAAVNERGAAYFKTGEIEKCLTDFEAYIKVRPQAYPAHWRYGIACYYAGRYADGAKQFKAGEVEFGDDVENVFWHYLCTAKLDGVEKARERMLKLEPSKPDRRTGFMEIYALIQGKSTPERVLAVVEDPKLPEEGKTERLFYAHLYIGLNHEAEGRREKALEHLKKADALQIGHYMWDVGHVHLMLAGKK